MIHRDPKATSRRLTRRAVAVRVGVLFLSAAIVGAVALRLPSRPPPTPLTFVDRALGSPSSDASLERRLATGAILAIDALGINARVGSATIALASRNAGHGSWHRYGSGVMRATNFGRESILFGINRAEQFLTVTRHQGKHRWEWDLNVRGLEPSPLAEKYAGIRLIVAESFENIYRQNCDNIGILTTTDFSVAMT